MRPPFVGIPCHLTGTPQFTPFLSDNVRGGRWAPFYLLIYAGMHRQDGCFAALLPPAENWPQGTLTKQQADVWAYQIFQLSRVGNDNVMRSDAERLVLLFLASGWFTPDGYLAPELFGEFNGALSEDRAMVSAQNRFNQVRRWAKQRNEPEREHAEARKFYDEWGRWPKGYLPRGDADTGQPPSPPTQSPPSAATEGGPDNGLPPTKRTTAAGAIQGDGCARKGETEPDFVASFPLWTTGDPRAQRVLDACDKALDSFKKATPEYKQAKRRGDAIRHWLATGRWPAPGGRFANGQWTTNAKETPAPAGGQGSVSPAVASGDVAARTASVTGSQPAPATDASPLAALQAELAAPQAKPVPPPCPKCGMEFLADVSPRTRERHVAHCSKPNSKA